MNSVPFGYDLEQILRIALTSTACGSHWLDVGTGLTLSLGLRMGTGCLKRHVDGSTLRFTGLTGCLKRHVDGSTLRYTGLTGCLKRHVDGSTVRCAGLTGCLKRHVDGSTVRCADGGGCTGCADGDGCTSCGDGDGCTGCADGDDEGLLLVDVEKKVERCKVGELFIMGRESTGLKNQFLWDCFLYPLLYPDLTICMHGDW